jgi:NAD(P)-dependent dehydrogenase (short-subunit alcohol dehydrogenase family)
MSSIQSQFLKLKEHHAPYPEIDPKTTLQGSAAGKTVFISGASRGIGQATAVAFAQAGAKAIYIIARSENGLHETLEQIAAANPETETDYLVCDVTDSDRVREAVEDCAVKFGGIDMVHANAGYLGEWNKIGQSDIDSWWWTWDVNVKGVYLVARYALPHLVESARESDGSTGHLVLTSSIGAQLLMPGASDYQTSKHAVNRLCEFIDADHAADGIKCFCIHPGGVATNLGKRMPKEYHQYLTDEPELAAGFIVWLASGQADWAKGRYLSSTWDVGELLAMKEEILADDLLVNRLRTKG